MADEKQRKVNSEVKLRPDANEMRDGGGHRVRYGNTEMLKQKKAEQETRRARAEAGIEEDRHRRKTGNPGLQRLAEQAEKDAAEKRAKDPRPKMDPERAALIKGVKTERRLKTALYYAVELLIDVALILIIVRGFSTSFSFAHDVFYDRAMTPGSNELVTVKIEDGFTTSSVAESLVDAGVINNKYVMVAKIKVGEYGNKIVEGTYALSPGMTSNQILAIITHQIDMEDEEEEEEDKTATTTDAIKIIDNSGAGAGEGADEGDSSVEGGESEGGEESDGGESAE